MKRYAILLASGDGLRFGSLDNGLPKQFAVKDSKSLLEMSYDVFEKCSLIDNIIVVTQADYFELVEELLPKSRHQKLLGVAAGGATRFDSSALGLEFLLKYLQEISDFSAESSQILIHDAVRAFITPEVIERVIEGLDAYDAIQPVIDINETLVQKINDTWITQDRANFKLVQTPQGFRAETLISAYNAAKASNEAAWTPTDDISVVQKFAPNAKIGIVQGDRRNLKVTFPEDLEFSHAQ